MRMCVCVCVCVCVQVIKLTPELYLKSQKSSWNSQRPWSVEWRKIRKCDKLHRAHHGTICINEGSEAIVETYTYKHSLLFKRSTSSEVGIAGKLSKGDWCLLVTDTIIRWQTYLYLSIYLSIYMSIYLISCRSIQTPVHPSFPPSIRISMCACISISV